MVDEAPTEVEASDAAPPRVDITVEAPVLPFPNYELLVATGMDKYAGQTAHAGTARTPLRSGVSHSLAPSPAHLLF